MRNVRPGGCSAFAGECLKISADRELDLEPESGPHPVARGGPEEAGVQAGEQRYQSSERFSKTRVAATREMHFFCLRARCRGNGCPLRAHTGQKQGSEQRGAGHTNVKDFRSQDGTDDTIRDGHAGQSKGSPVLSFSDAEKDDDQRQGRKRKNVF